MTSSAVIDASDATFAHDVVQRSRELPVVVDFWAPWCGPCRTLSPVLERLAEEFAGDVQLVKVNIDENPAIASTFKIQSIPAVVAFRGGTAVSSFLGAQPEPTVRAFFTRLVPSEADRLAAEGARALTAGDLEAAREHFEQALTRDPNHRDAVIGLAGVLGELGDLDRARELAERWPGDPVAKRVLAHVNLRRVAAGADRAALEQRLAENPNDAEAHYRLGALLALAAEWEPALEHLLSAVMMNRKLDDDGARKRMLDVLQLLGDDHPLTPEYRSRLANVLF